MSVKYTPYMCEAEMKVGDKVKIRSLKYFKEHFRDEVFYFASKIYFTIDMIRYCDKVMTVAAVGEEKGVKYITCKEAPTLDGGYLFSYDTFTKVAKKPHHDGQGIS